MGFSRLIVANPMIYDDPGYFNEEARRMAWQAVDILDARRVEPNLGDALAAFDLVIGTTSNPPPGAALLPPRGIAAAIAERLAAEPSSTAALVLGQEDIGLTRENLSRCHLIGAIPSAEAYRSLNLSHAALVFLYELRLVFDGMEAAPAPSLPSVEHPAPPRHAQLEAFYARLEEALEEIGFFQGTARAHMMRELRLFFNRALLTSRELAILEGLVHQVLWASRRAR